MLVVWALESIANPKTIISLSCKWDLFSAHGKVRPGNACPVAVINLLAAQERRPCRAYSSGEATWAFVTGMEQPLAESPTREGKRTANEPSLWHTPSRPQANVSGRCTTGLDAMFIFVNEGIRKLSDLNTVRGNNTKFILIRWHLVARTGSVESELAPQTR